MSMVHLYHDDPAPSRNAASGPHASRPPGSPLSTRNGAPGSAGASAGRLREGASAATSPRKIRVKSLVRALCLVLPSSREGYGLIVVEAAARGVPSIVVAGPDNAATELIAEGVNGFVVPSASAEDLADGIVRVRDGGPALRESTARWFADHADELSLTSSLQLVSRLLPSTVTKPG